MPKEYVQCNVCHCTYDDEDSVGLVKDCLREPEPYAPCPKIDCPGQMEVKED